MKIALEDQEEYGSLSDNPLLQRAEEIVRDLILEYGIPIEVQTAHTTRKEKRSSYEHGNYEQKYITLTEINYVVGEQKFENIKNLRKALNNIAFM